MTDALHLIAVARYTARMGDPPVEDVEPIIEQFTGIVHLLHLGAPPYADFSTWGPYGVRNKKRLKLGGIHIAGDGTFEKCEQFGPKTYECWARAYRVLHTCLVMHDTVLPSQFGQYMSLTKSFHDDFGPRCWPTIYQADVRCRQERMQTVRRKIVMLRNENAATAAAQGFDPATPWRYIWREA